MTSDIVNIADNLFDLLEQQAAAAPQHSGAITRTGPLSYADWLDGTRRVAGALTADGIGPGDTVALLAPNRSEWLEVAFGCAALGARLAAINTWVRGPELEYLLSYSRPKVLITVGRHGRQNFLADLEPIELPSLGALVVIGDEVPAGAIGYGDWTSQAEPHDGAARRAPDDVAYVLFTSGSTSKPKGVALTHAHLVANGFAIGERQGLGPEDRLLLCSPLFWSLGSANALMAALTHRTTLVLQEQFDAARALDLIERHACTAMYTLPLMTQALLSEPGFTPERVATLRRGLTFGPPAEVRRAAEGLGMDLVCNLYGLTEVYGNCCVSPHDAPLQQRIAASGPALDEVEVEAVDPESGAPVAPGEVGELRVRGRVTPGYLTDDGSLTAVVDADGWFRTGDLGSLDADGWVTFVGRDSEMIKTAGINVSPAEVEDVLLGHEAIVEAAVTGAPDPVRDEVVVAFVRLRSGTDADPEALRTWAKERCSSYKVPARIAVVDDFPRTSTGKLARKVLKEQATALLGRA